MSKIQQCIIWNCYGNLCAKKWLLLFYEKKVVSDKKSRQLRRGQVRRNFTNIQSYKFRKHARLIFLLLKILLNFQKVISLDFCFLLCLFFFFFLRFKITSYMPDSCSRLSLSFLRSFRSNEVLWFLSCFG